MITLRDLRPEDEAQILAWRNLPEVARFMYTDHAIGEAEHHAWFVGLGADPRRRYWIVTSDGEDVGLANIYALDEENRRCYWAFYLASPNVRGKGVGSFVEYSVLRHVFDALGLNKLCCEVLVFNEPVIKMHESFGFVREGLFRDHVFKQGTPHDVVCLAMLRSEWEGRRAETERRLREKGLIP